MDRATLTRLRPPTSLDLLRADAGALAVALFALSALDMVVTRFALVYLGAIEANPLFAPLVATDAGIVLKLGIPAVVLVMASRITQPRAVSALRVVVGIYVVVVLIGLVQLAWYAPAIL